MIGLIIISVILAIVGAIIEIDYQERKNKR